MRTCNTVSTFALLSLVILAPTSAAFAQASPPPPPAVLPSTLEPPERANSINGSPLGALVGNYALNYERLVNGTHGFLVEGVFSMRNDGGSSSSLYGGGVGYRWHWSGRQNSGFLGLMAGYTVGTGEGKVGTGSGEQVFDLTISAPFVVGNIGKRWAWDNGLNLTFRVGGGWAGYNVTSDSNDPNAQSAVDLVQDLLTFLPITLDGELSIGYAF